jgi:hypothetical protein
MHNICRQYQGVKQMLRMLNGLPNFFASKNYLGELYRRTTSRKGKKRAGIVVAHAMLRIAYYSLTRKEMYVDLGEY